jgi:hypothetical protein
MLNVDLKRLVIMEIFCLFINLQCYIHVYCVIFFQRVILKRFIEPNLMIGVNILTKEKFCRINM